MRVLLSFEPEPLTTLLQATLLNSVHRFNGSVGLPQGITTDRA